MRYFLIILIFLLSKFPSQGKEYGANDTGKVSYITSQNVYVKFESTESIHIGDTLFLNLKGNMIPVLIVDNKSSISCVCSPISATKLNISDEIVTQESEVRNRQEDDLPTNGYQPKYQSNSLEENKESAMEIEETGSFVKPDKMQGRDANKQDISGRISVASYNTLSEKEANHRMRYTLAIRGDHLANTRLSMDSYITFRHTLDEWEDVKSNLNSALKIYSLALMYNINNSSRIALGRKINPKISSMGAMDGLQLEQKIGTVLLGVLAGSRPDYLDYSLNLDLFQYGAYASHELSSKSKFMQNTLGYIEQRNNAEIDRRFIYFQHNSSLFKNLNLFTSAEISLYEKVNDQPKNVLDLTNLYASLSYRVSRKLRVTASYDNRKNVQYYETFKSFIDRLIEEETRQGVRLNANYRIFKSIIWGVNAGWRFQKSERNLSKNINSYLTFSRIPSLNIRTTITANFLQTNYLNSKIFGIRISKDIIPRKLSGNINYRMVDYRYLNYETVTKQNIAGINLSWNIMKKLTMYVDYEGTFDQQNVLYHRIYAKIIQRF